MLKPGNTPRVSGFLITIFCLLFIFSASEAASPKKRLPFGEARIFIEYNESANDAGFHVFLDAEDWKEIEIIHPKGRSIFEVEGQGGFGKLGMTELFFEGAEPSLDDVALEDLLALFPEGDYKFVGKTVDGESLFSTASLSHTVPAGPANVSATIAGNNLTITWDAVTQSAGVFPDRPVTIAGYQVIVGSFQVTVPASTTKVTVSPEFVASLQSGTQNFEVLAIEENGNQTITEATFVKP